MEITNEIKSAFQALAPELLPDCDVKRLVSDCEPATFRQRTKACGVDDLIVFTDCVLKEKNEFLTTVGNILVSEIASRIKNADCLYAVVNVCLPKPYPHIAGTDAIIFFDEAQGEAYLESLQKKGDKVRLIKLEKNNITGFFTVLTRFGIEFIRLEPLRCKLRYKQKQLIETNFDSISGCHLGMILLGFIQARSRDPESKLVALMEATTLAAVANSEFACMGITANNNFEALLITDKRDGSKWIPCFTDTMEIQETYTTIPDIAKTLMTSQVMTLSFCELEKFMKLEAVSGVVINIGGMGFRINKETCAKIIDIAKRRKRKKDDNL